MSVDYSTAFPSREVKLKLCEYCIEVRGIEKAMEVQAQVCSKCKTPLVGSIVHFQTCLTPDECTYEHMHEACYTNVVLDLMY